ncbi:SusD/RagB family nutrient-binding outer membrane lipoprotein [Solitalea koreensis]|uniref:Starch-binding associating with outer membrane n=1 Tax=Solitalea koreensis TaxID=543615 RepID=A0A521CA44_9SPHI|nr:SusD/RagB family nutrient-binding outer membrane lipoprotein [Solitalea koreensis]SMO56244.1 Starch-binding associating with outer membrane [Solitalea koreensis]
MKRLTIILTIVFIAITSCQDKLDEYAMNPNAPAVASAPLLLSATEVSTFAAQTGDIARVTSLFDQHVAGTNFQYATYARYIYNEGDVLNNWQTIYAGALINAKTLLDTYGAGSPYYDGIGKILYAINLGTATDLWGDVPDTDGFNGKEGSYSVKYDTQEQIIARIQTMLDEAIADFAKTPSDNLFVPANDDIIFGGNILFWKRAAYIVKARYANRLSQIDPAGSANQALTFLAAADLTAKETGDMKALFFNVNTNFNQWAAFQSNRGGYIQMGEVFINLMKAGNDPRLPFFATKDAAGGYSGTPVNDQVTVSTSKFGPGIASNTSPLPMVTYSEAKFIEAEANLRLGNAGAAAAAYNEAIKASLRSVTGAEDPTFVANFASATSVTLQQIITQKYIALFTQIEPYNDWRRTGFPVLVPNSNGQPPQIPLRFPTSIDERLYNPQAVVTNDLSVPVWWDK